MKKAAFPFLSLLLVCVLGAFSPALSQEETHTNFLGMEFVLIPAGSFIMGCDKSVENCNDDETPRHTVIITDPFYLGKYEVTQEQWVAVMGSRSNPSTFRGRPRPVEKVSYHDVQVFIRRLNGQESAGEYRLPTEAEWEYAARAGSRAAYCFGDDEDRLGQYAWYGENAREKTHPVGQKQPNNWGLYDMHGNVEEWVQDWKSVYTGSSRTNPAGMPSGEYRVLRGGGWCHDAAHCRSASRSSYSPDRRFDKLGFRLAFSPKRK